MYVELLLLFEISLSCEEKLKSLNWFVEKSSRELASVLQIKFQMEIKL